MASDLEAAPERPSPTPPPHPLAAKVVAGDVRALARVLRLVDDGVGEHRAILKQLFSHTGRAWTIGVTGVPGAGKSTLTDKLIAVFRRQGQKVAVVCIDPTSPFSGGAILGDRIRMGAHTTDPGVFIRSLATRGALGGLSRSAVDVIRVMDAWQADVVLVETVGVGQDELEVTRTVDTTLVVMAPGMGDDVQAIKAGILECADVFSVNKADREGADATERDLELMIALGQSTKSAFRKPGATSTPVGAQGSCGAKNGCGARGSCHGRSHEKAEPRLRGPSGSDEDGQWIAPIVRTIATSGQGLDELCQRLADHREWLMGTEAGAVRRLARLRESMRAQLRDQLLAAAEERMAADIDAAVADVASRTRDPYSAAEELVARLARVATQTPPR